MQVITHKWMHVAHTFDSRPYEEEDAARIFRGIVRSLDQLHSAGMLHGNLSPDTVLVDLNDIDRCSLSLSLSLSLCLSLSLSLSLSISLSLSRSRSLKASRTC